MNNPADNQHWRYEFQDPVEIHQALDYIASWRRKRRERIATAALQGLLADSKVDGSVYRIAGQAVLAADALIAELDKT